MAHDCLDAPEREPAVTIWLVVMQDRHIDDTYLAASTRARAEAIAQKLMDEWWNGRYRGDWRRQEDQATPWMFVHQTYDDGPYLHIETVEVEGE